MTIADTDKDGMISFTEFFFFVLVCQTASKVIKSDFKKTGGKMNISQLSKCLREHRKKCEFGKKHDMLKRHDEDFAETNQMMCMRIFNGRDEITVDEYLQFRAKL